VAHYLLVDDRDGSVLAELSGPQQALRLLARHGGQSQGSLPVSVVRVAHEERSLAGVTSIVSMRTLPPLHARPPHRD
jgi:hypothetical protein